MPELVNSLSHATRWGGKCIAHGALFATGMLLAMRFIGPLIIGPGW